MSSPWLARVCHGVLRRALADRQRAFVQGSRDLEAVQRRQLSRLLQRVAAVDPGIDPRWCWEDFRDEMPQTRWQDWQGRVERQRQSRQRCLADSPVLRYQPTSGSTSAVKWVPYTRAFLAELDAAIAPWLGDLYARFPGVREGHHYWSLSWLPTAMRAAQRGDLNDDLALLSAGKRWLAGQTQAVPQDASLASTSDGSLFVTLVYLAADARLSALSVWSPTFAITLLERLATWREEIADVLARGRWSARAAGAAHLHCPKVPTRAALLREWNGEPDAAFFCTLWPQLALVSAWDTAAAAPWATQLQELLPQAAFQGKGLWATEGVVTIPQGGQTLLAYRSHVYEFVDLDNERVLAPWELRVGQQVAPLLSTGSGLLRYRFDDVLRVEGFQAGIPALRFLGRLDGTDLVGEKISTSCARQAIAAIAPDSALVPVTLLALDDAGAGRPGYVLLLEDRRRLGVPALDVPALSAELERRLCRHFHYQLARNLGQLVPARVVCAPDLRTLYAEHCVARGMIEGNIKLEILRHWRGELPATLRSALAPAGVALTARQGMPA